MFIYSYGPSCKYSSPSVKKLPLILYLTFTYLNNFVYLVNCK